MKTWCKHIKKQFGISENRWKILPKDWSGQRVFIPIPSSWKVCPICQTERPTKSNKRADTQRFLMDNDQ